MITMSGIRNALWCAIAFGIVACAAAPMPSDELAVASSAVERAERAQAAQFAQVEVSSSAGSRQLNRRVEIVVSNADGAIPGRTAAGSP